jgi:hypothetical protein
MNGARPGGPLSAHWVVDAGEVVLVFADTVHGGGIRLRFETPAYAQCFLDGLAMDLDDISETWGE